MKTQVFKNKESFRTNDQLMIILYPVTIILSLICFGIILSAGKNILTKNTSEKLLLNSMSSISHVQFATQPEQQMEVEKLYARNNRVSEKMELEILTAKVQNYIVPEKEPELDISMVTAIDFSETEIATENQAQKSEYIKFEYLENMAKERYNELLEFYALEKQVREYLVIEKEPLLELEDWMTSEKCWCHQINEPVAIINSK